MNSINHEIAGSSLDRQKTWPTPHDKGENQNKPQKDLEIHGQVSPFIGLTIFLLAKVVMFTRC